MSDAQLRLATGLVVVLLAISGVLYMSGPKEEEPADEDATAAVWKVKNDDVTRVVVDRADGRVVLAKDGDDWRVEEPYQAPAEPREQQGMAGDRKRLRKQRGVDEVTALPSLENRAEDAERNEHEAQRRDHGAPAQLIDVCQERGIQTRRDIEADCVDSTGIRPWLPRAVRVCRVPLQDHRLLFAAGRAGGALGRSYAGHRLAAGRCADSFAKGGVGPARGRR
jgi:hypothetical protein